MNSLVCGVLLCRERNPAYIVPRLSPVAVTTAMGHFFLVESGKWIVQNGEWVCIVVVSLISIPVKLAA
jgi:hypothetical protein